MERDHYPGEFIDIPKIIRINVPKLPPRRKIIRPFRDIPYVLPRFLKAA